MMKAKFTLPLLVCSLSLGAQQTNEDAPPAPIHPIPTQAQMDWHRLETYAFIHFGLNTYNDLEWGYGNTPASTFSPRELDCEQWVSTLKQAGMKGVILTAKHHDGFCLWPTRTTEYSVKNSPWKGRRGDLVKDLSEACRRHGLKFGIYLSPWDRNHAGYGKEEYQRVFFEQIRELTTGYGPLFEYWFDGANGGTGWYGGADEARSIDASTYYRYEEAAQMLRANNPDIMIFGGTVPTIRWIGNEAGWAGQTNWAPVRLDSLQRRSILGAYGQEDGTQWIPGEVDVSLRPGWFYHQREDHQVRSIPNLVDLYYQSVGRNANLLLNCPINLEGKIPLKDSINLVGWRAHLDRSFAKDLLQGSSIEASNSRRGRAFSPQNLLDGSDETYWATADGVSSASVSLELPEQREINNVVLQEYIPLGQRIQAFALDYRDAEGQWHPLPTTDSLTTIGYKRIIRSQTVGATALRLRILKAKGAICLSEIRAYRAPVVADAPQVRRDHADRLHITSPVAGAKLRYRIHKGAKVGKWISYREPVVLEADNVDVEAEITGVKDLVQPQGQAYTLGYRQSKIKVEGLTAEDRARLLDADGRTAYRMVDGERELDFVFARPLKIGRVVYTPDQRRDARGHIQRYELYLDGELTSSGELANIKNNPIPTAIVLHAPRQVERVRLRVVEVVDGAPFVSIGGIEFFER